MQQDSLKEFQHQFLANYINSKKRVCTKHINSNKGQKKEWEARKKGEKKITSDKVPDGIQASSFFVLICVCVQVSLFF